MKNYEMKIDLQRFADASASLNNTTATMTKEMKTFYEKRLIDQAEPRLVHDQFADYYPVPQNGGKTIEFRKYDSLPKASTPLTEGVTPNGQTLNVTTITSDLHQYGGWTPLTDVLQMTAIDNNVVQATRVLASQAGRTMDSITRDVLAGGTNVLYAPKVAEDGTETAVNSRKALDKTCTLTPKIFFRAAAQLHCHHPPLCGLRPEDQQGVCGGAQVRRPGHHVPRRDRQAGQHPLRGDQRGQDLEG